MGPVSYTHLDVYKRQAYDKNGIWSGHAVINDDGIPQLIYTAGGDKMGVGIAFPKDTALITACPDHIPFLS